jgi:hypothetical protein
MSPLEATLHVYTFKAGVLAKLAHDLRLSMHDFDVRLHGTTIEARFATASLEVDGVVHGRVLDPNVLSSRDMATIRDTMRTLLDCDRWPEARFTGELLGERGGPNVARRVSGRLQLRSIVTDLSGTVTEQGTDVRVAFEFPPSLFGITPYKALGGALRLKDLVEVELRLRLAGGKAPPPEAATDGALRWQPSR